MTSTAMTIQDLNERAIEILAGLIKDIENGKIIVDKYLQKNDNVETTSKLDSTRTYAFTGVSHVSMRLTYPRQVEKFRKMTEEDGLTEHYA